MTTALSLTGVALLYLLCVTYHQEIVRAYEHAEVRFAILIGILFNYANWTDLRDTRKFRERQSVRALTILSRMMCSGYRLRYAMDHANDEFARFIVLWNAGDEVFVFDPVTTDFYAMGPRGDRRDISPEDALFALVTRSPWKEPVSAARKAVFQMRHLSAYDGRRGLESV